MNMDFIEILSRSSILIDLDFTISA